MAKNLSLLASNAIARIAVRVATGLVLVIMGLLSLPELQQGVPPLQAISHVVSTSSFIMVLVVTLFAALVLVGNAYYAMKKIPSTVAMKTDGQSEMKTRRMMATLGALLLILSLIMLFGVISVPNHHYNHRNRDIVLQSCFCLYGLFVILNALTFHPPGKISRQLFGGPEQRDERFNFVWQTSAATTLYWILGLLFVSGSLFDIFITHQWPVRSLGEVLGILIIWTLSYRYWNKRL